MLLNCLYLRRYTIIFIINTWFGWASKMSCVSCYTRWNNSDRFLNTLNILIRVLNHFNITVNGSYILLFLINCCICVKQLKCIYLICSRLFILSTIFISWVIHFFFFGIFILFTVFTPCWNIVDFQTGDVPQLLLLPKKTNSVHRFDNEVFLFIWK